MHTLNEVMSMKDGSRYWWFTSCTCGWWHEADRVPAVDFEQDKANQQSWWVGHMKEIKLRFDGRHL